MFLNGGWHLGHGLIPGEEWGSAPSQLFSSPGAHPTTPKTPIPKHVFAFPPFARFVKYSAYKSIRTTYKELGPGMAYINFPQRMIVIAVACGCLNLMDIFKYPHMRMV